jgi:hypothetical protein
VTPSRDNVIFAVGASWPDDYSRSMKAQSVMALVNGRRVTFAAGFGWMALATLLFSTAFQASAHPPSGIVVDQSGNVFAAGSIGAGPQFPGFVWRIDAQGKVTSFHKGSAHYLALESRGKFDRDRLNTLFSERKTPWLGPVALSAARPSLLRADGCPIVVHSDGNIYFAAGNLEVSRLTPDGEVTPLGRDLKATTEKLGGIKGLASGPEGTLYLACPSAVLSLKPDGSVATLIHPIVLDDCEKDPQDSMAEPGLRGLAVDAHGTVFAAATGCRRLVKIASDGKPTVVLRAEPPWAPTGVAIHRAEAYVLEYSHPNSEKHEDWQPRVRKVGQNGKVEILATLSKDWN